MGEEPHLLSASEIRAWLPDAPPLGRALALAGAKRAARASGCGLPGQQMGERWPVGCVALEITQRCNLDCTLCYLSEHSQAVHDLPLQEVFRRIDLIREYYGTGVDVQITGGDPTLRVHDELIAIVRRLAQQGQRSTLMTNGIRARRTLLRALAGAGLTDVAFHVDTTQQRKGYRNEVALNVLREDYLARARGLGLSVLFNTTVHGANVHEIAALARFFAAYAGDVRTASFQLQADTGRGTLRGRPSGVAIDPVWAAIETGIGTQLNPSASLVGHPRCTRYGLGLVINGRVHDAFEDAEFIAALQRATAGIPLERVQPATTGARFLRWLARNPRFVAPCLAWGARRLRETGRDLLGARGRVHSISFLVHDFMHACGLEQERIRACAFKVITARGPLSMCLHNAVRDELVLAPIALSGGQHWTPLTGERAPIPITVGVPDPVEHGLKHTRGRTRDRLLKARTGPRAGYHEPGERLESV